MSQTKTYRCAVCEAAVAVPVAQKHLPNCPDGCAHSKMIEQKKGSRNPKDYPSDCHITHCCIIHGCKYGNYRHDCTVVENDLPITGCEECGMANGNYYGDHDEEAADAPHPFAGYSIRQDEPVFMTTGRNTGRRGKITAARQENDNIRVKVSLDQTFKSEWCDLRDVHLIDPEDAVGEGPLLAATLYMSEEDRAQFEDVVRRTKEGYSG